MSDWVEVVDYIVALEKIVRQHGPLPQGPTYW